MTITKKLALAATLSLAAVSAPALAQAVPPATIILVDMDSVIGDSSAGKGAQAQLQSQASALQSRAQTLAAGFRSEEDALNKAAQNKTMAQPALEAKATDLQRREAAAQAEINQRQRQLAANQQFVLKQIDDAVQPIITQVMKEKGATLALANNVTLQAASGLDVTQTVLQRLNAKLPSVNVNAPAPPAAGR